MPSTSYVIQVCMKEQLSVAFDVCDIGCLSPTLVESGYKTDLARLGEN